MRTAAFAAVRCKKNLDNYISYIGKKVCIIRMVLLKYIYKRVMLF